MGIMNYIQKTKEYYKAKAKVQTNINTEKLKALRMERQEREERVKLDNEIALEKKQIRDLKYKGVRDSVGKVSNVVKKFKESLPEKKQEFGFGNEDKKKKKEDVWKL